MAKRNKSSEIKEEVREMKAAIDFYRVLARDSYQRSDSSGLSFQASNLLSILGEKNVFPKDLENNGSHIKGFIFSLQNLAAGQLSKEDFSLNYFAVMYCASEVNEELDYFLKNN